MELIEKKEKRYSKLRMFMLLGLTLLALIIVYFILNEGRYKYSDSENAIYAYYSLNDGKEEEMVALNGSVSRLFVKHGDVITFSLLDNKTPATKWIVEKIPDEIEIITIENKAVRRYSQFFKGGINYDRKCISFKVKEPTDKIINMSYGKFRFNIVLDSKNK